MIQRTAPYSAMKTVPAYSIICIAYFYVLEFFLVTVVVVNFVPLTFVRFDFPTLISTIKILFNVSDSCKAISCFAGSWQSTL